MTLQAYVEREVLFAFCIVGIVITSLITFLRVYVRLSKQRQLREDDFVLFVAVAFYISLAGLYIADLPYLYGFIDALAETPLQMTRLSTSYRMMMTYNFAVTLFFWAVLWSVKLSLLLFFRRIILHVRFWMRAWWAITAFTLATFVGCVISQAASCGWHIENFLVIGRCTAEWETNAQLASLYYSFAADVATDILIMALPLRIVLSLHMSRRDRWILACLFGVTVIEIAVAIIRVFLIWARTGNDTPSPPWLGFWAIIQDMVAIIVGCIPVISQIFRGPSQSSSIGSDPYGRRRFRSSASPSGKTAVEYGDACFQLVSPVEPPSNIARIQSRTEISVGFAPLPEVERSSFAASCSAIVSGGVHDRLDVPPAVWRS